MFRVRVPGGSCQYIFSKYYFCLCRMIPSFIVSRLVMQSVSKTVMQSVSLPLLSFRQSAGSLASSLIVSTLATFVAVYLVRSLQNGHWSCLWVSMNRLRCIRISWLGCISVTISSRCLLILFKPCYLKSSNESPHDELPSPVTPALALWVWIQS